MNELQNTESLRNYKKVYKLFSCLAIRNPICTDANESDSEKTRRENEKLWCQQEQKICFMKFCFFLTVYDFNI